MATLDEETSSEVSKGMKSDDETDSGSTDSESNVLCDDLIPTPSIEAGNWQETGDHRNSILSWQSHDISRPRNRKVSPKKEPMAENEISLLPFGIYPEKYINMHLKNKQYAQKRNVNQIARKKEFLIDPDMFKEVLNHVRRMREKYSTMVEEAFGKSKEFGKITSFTYPVFPSYDKDEEGSKEAEDPEDHNKTPEGSGKTERSSKTPDRHDKAMEGPSKNPERFSKTPERHDKPMESRSKTPDRFSKTPELFDKPMEGPSKTSERSRSNESTFEADKHQEPELDIGYEKRKDIFYKFLKMMMKKVKEIEENENLAESPSVGVKTEKKVSFSNMNDRGSRKDIVKLDSAVQTSNRNSNKNVQTDVSKKKMSKKKPNESSESLLVAKKPVFRPNSFKAKLIPISSKSFHSKAGIESSKRSSSKSYSKLTPSSDIDSSRRKSDINITNIKLGNEDIVMRKKPNEAVIILGESGKKESVKISITTQGNEAENKKNKVSIDDVLMHIEDRILERFNSKKSSARRRSPYRETKSSVLKKISPDKPDVSTSKHRKSSSIKWDKKDSDSSSKSDRKYSRQSSDRKSSDRSRKDKKAESISKSDNSRTKSSDRRSSYNSRKGKKSYDSSSKHDHRPKSVLSSKNKRSLTDDSKTRSEYLRSKSSDKKSSEWSRNKKESRSKSPERSSKTAKSTTDSLKSSLKKSSDVKYANKKSDLSRLYVLASPKTREGILAKSPKKSESTRQKSATTTSAEIADLSEDSTIVSEKSVRSKYKPIERNPTKYFPRVISPPGKSLDLPEVPEEDDRSEGKGAGLMKIAEHLNHARIRDVLVNGRRAIDDRQLKNAISAHVPIEILDKRKKASLPNAKILSYYEPEKAKAEEAKVKKPALKVKRKFIRPKVTENKTKNAESTTINLTELIEKLALLEKAEKLLRLKENGKKKCWKY